MNPSPIEPAGAAEVFIAINHIRVRPDYRERMEQSFRERARAVDRRPGFLGMEVLRPEGEDEPYLVISRWRSRADFEAWADDSEEFREGHRRALEALRAARAAGEPPPMQSTLRAYVRVAD